MKITQLGEFSLIERFVKKFLHARRCDIVVDIGDDAAVVKISHNSCLLITKDIFLERVHFKREWSTFFQIGYKAIVANISDIAAMGGASKLYAVVGLATPVDISVENVDNLVSGIKSAAKKYGVLVVGGDTVLSKKDIIISVTLLGVQDIDKVIRRSGAKVGDLICATGTFGDAAAGVEILKRWHKRKTFQEYNKKYGQLVHVHRLPEARLKESLFISEVGAVTSMIDSSDGLAACVNFLCKASGVGAKIYLERVPLSDEFKSWASSLKRFPWEVVLNGGEEFELVFTVSPDKLDLIKKNIKLSIIGEITEGKSVEFILNGKKTNYKVTGYQNF